VGGERKAGVLEAEKRNADVDRGVNDKIKPKFRHIKNLKPACTLGKGKKEEVSTGQQGRSEMEARHSKRCESN